MQHPLRLWMLFLLFCAAAAPLPASADTASSEESVRQANAACFSCHAPAAIHNPPRPGLDLSALTKLANSPTPETYPARTTARSRARSVTDASTTTTRTPKAHGKSAATVPNATPAR